jgi:6-phosphogluconate dehydrogenase
MQSIIFIIGVSGSGKTTVGQVLSEQTGIPFFDADDFHSSANIEKMKAGIPLTDEDRAGWLQGLNQLARQHQQTGAIIACSALKQIYRNQLSEHLQQVKWVYLKGNYHLIHERLQQRPHHYFSASMLHSQFDILEEPKEALEFDVKQEVQVIVNAVVKKYFMLSEFGMIGLGVMGKSLALNMAGKGISLSLFNRFVKNTEEKVAEKFIETHEILQHAKGFEELHSFVASLESPRKILLMVNAGLATDIVIDEVKLLLSPGDVIIDGGNSLYKDTERRIVDLKKYDVHFIGAGISGGEEGALKGPSIMPGGDEGAYETIKPFMEVIAAKDKQGKPCCGYVSTGGSGHFVKMVHNAIEYAEMQLLSEVYDLMRNGLKLSPDAIADEFKRWNDGVLNSYLLEITIKILQKREGDEWLLDKILDTSSSKGTGSWAVAAAAELSVPAGMMTSALYARYLSSEKNTRVQLHQTLPHQQTEISIHTDQLRCAYELARIINHHQGFELIKAAASAYNWSINFKELARIWTNGCIIRSALMEQLSQIRLKDHLLLHPAIISTVQKNRKDMQDIVSVALQNGFAIPALSDALNYINAIGTAHSAMNLIQAQRDYFGAHTYQRTDDDSGKSYHTEWEKE